MAGLMGKVVVELQQIFPDRKKEDLHGIVSDPSLHYGLITEQLLLQRAIEHILDSNAAVSTPQPEAQPMSPHSECSRIMDNSPVAGSSLCPTPSNTEKKTVVKLKDRCYGPYFGSRTSTSPVSRSRSATPDSEDIGAVQKRKSTLQAVSEDEAKKDGFEEGDADFEPAGACKHFRSKLLDAKVSESDSEEDIVRKKKTISKKWKIMSDDDASDADSDDGGDNVVDSDEVEKKSNYVLDDSTAGKKKKGAKGKGKGKGKGKEKGKKRRRIKKIKDSSEEGEAGTQSENRASSSRRKGMPLKVKLSLGGSFCGVPKVKVNGDHDNDADNISHVWSLLSDGDSSDLPRLPEGTVVVQPEPMDEKKIRFKGPEFKSSVNSGSKKGPGGCIDLTANDTIDGDIIDLTDSVGMRGVVSAADVDNAEEDNDTANEIIIDLEQEATPHGASTRAAARSSSTIDVDNLSDDDSDLPAPPFNLANTSPLSSPEGLKVTCPVCMDSYSHIRRAGRQLYATTCGHIFCYNCINQALASQHRCPSCTERLTDEQIHPLYL